jgi:large subunit ribosomal protein L21
MYAVIRTGGKQYRVKPGEILLVERLGSKDGSFTFSDVLLVSDGGTGIKVGTPSLSGASVAATILGEQKGKKVIVFKKKKRKGYRRKNGHRQIYARVRIDGITL